MSKALAELAAQVESSPAKVKTPPSIAPTVGESSSKEDRFKALAAVKATLDKQFSTTTSIVRMGDKIGQPVPSFSTGLYTLDFGVLGCGGIPKGRIIELFGPESSGKTTAALHFIAQEQARGNLAAIVDAEHALDPNYAAQLGVNVDDLLISQPDSGEQALETVEALVDSKAVSVIVVDSVAALTPQAELDGEMGDSHMGLQARLMSQAMRKLRGKCATNGVTVLFINQIRCLENSTPVFTRRGVVPISDLTVLDYVLSPTGKMCKVLGTHSAGWVNGKIVKPKYRRAVSMSCNHRQPVMTHDGLLDTKLGINLDEGDWLMYPRFGAKYEADGNMPDIKAQFLGMYFADGYIVQCKLKGYRISLGERSHDRRSLAYTAAKGFFGEDNEHVRLAKSGSVNVHGMELINAFTELGVGVLGINKQVPACVLQSKKDIANFLRGASFDTHGHTANGFVWTFETEKQAYDIAHLLSLFRINADFRARLHKDSKKGNHLYITAEDAVIFREEIGFLEYKKVVQSQKFKSHTNGRGKYDNVPLAFAKRVFDLCRTKVKGITPMPHYQAIVQAIHRGVNVGRIGLLNFATACNSQIDLSDTIELLTNNRFYEIEKVEDSAFNATDICVDGELFVADGIATHNSKIGVMFGSPETTTGGNALKFYASVRLDIRRKEVIKEGDVQIGHQIRFKAVKNKVGPPFRETIVDLIYGKGLDMEKDLINYAVSLGVIEQKGAWFSFEGEKLGQGLANTVETLKGSLEAMSDIMEAIKKAQKAQEEAK